MEEVRAERTAARKGATSATGTAAHSARTATDSARSTRRSWCERSCTAAVNGTQRRTMADGGVSFVPACLAACRSRPQLRTAVTAALEEGQSAMTSQAQTGSWWFEE